MAPTTSRFIVFVARVCLPCLMIGQVLSLSPLCPLPPYDDDVHLVCQTENGDFSSLSNTETFQSDEPITLNIIEYNIDRNGYGGDGSNESGLDPIIALLNNSGLVPQADVITLSEVGRGCANYGGQNVSGAAEIAKQFGFYYTYAVEYVVISESDAENECSIGNALLSRYPIQNIQQLRYESQCCRYGDRYGGRISIIGDISLDGSNESSVVHVHSCHLESGQSNVEMVLESLVVREQQAGEMASFAFNDSLPVIITGDLNSPIPKIDPTILKLEKEGYVNSFKGKNESERELIQFDYLLSSPESLVDADYCSDASQCSGYSDHVPYWAQFVQQS